MEAPSSPTNDSASRGGGSTSGDIEKLTNFMPGLGVFLFRKDKNSRKRRRLFVQLGRSQKAKVVKVTYSVIEAICKAICPTNHMDLLDSVIRMHKRQQRRALQGTRPANRFTVCFDEHDDDDDDSDEEEGGEGEEEVWGDGDGNMAAMGSGRRETLLVLTPGRGPVGSGQQRGGDGDDDSHTGDDYMKAEGGLDESDAQQRRQLQQGGGGGHKEREGGSPSADRSMLRDHRQPPHKRLRQVETERLILPRGAEHHMIRGYHDKRSPVSTAGAATTTTTIITNSRMAEMSKEGGFGIGGSYDGGSDAFAALSQSDMLALRRRGLHLQEDMSPPLLQGMPVERRPSGSYYAPPHTDLPRRSMPSQVGAGGPYLSALAGLSAAEAEYSSRLGTSDPRQLNEALLLDNIRLSRELEARESLSAAAAAPLPRPPRMNALHGAGSTGSDGMPDVGAERDLAYPKGWTAASSASGPDSSREHHQHYHQTLRDYSAISDAIPSSTRGRSSSSSGMYDDVEDFGEARSRAQSAEALLALEKFQHRGGGMHRSHQGPEPGRARLQQQVDRY